MADAKKYIEIISKAVNTGKELNGETPIMVSLAFLEELLSLLKTAIQRRL